MAVFLSLLLWLAGEVVFLRRQLAIADRRRRNEGCRILAKDWERQLLGWLQRLMPWLRDSLVIVQPATVMRWYGEGFRAYWRWLSRSKGGRPPIREDYRALIRRMSRDNPLWGAPRIHGELLKLGVRVSERTVANYMVRRGRSPSPGWKAFLHNEADAIASLDLFVVPTVSFKLLYGLAILHHGRRELLHVAVTAHPTAEWLARQVTEAFAWDRVPRHLIRDNDGAYGELFRRRVHALGIRDHPISPRSPWQNGYAERVIGTLRRECLDHVIVFGETHLRRVLLEYRNYYNRMRTHLALDKDAPRHRAVQITGRILPQAILGGLHHQYVRI